METPLQIASAARVSCQLLEEEIADLVRKPSPLRGKRLTDRCAQMWQRIDAMAARIEDQQAEIERLQIALARPVEAPASVPVRIVETVAPTNPVRIEPATVTLSDSPMPAPTHRPPGFDRVRARLRRRPNPCALVELPEDRPKLTRAGNPSYKSRPASDNREGKLKGVADHGHEIATWRAVEQAWLEKKFDPEGEYTHAQINTILGRAPGCLDYLCLTLAEHRSLVKMIHVESHRWRFADRFGAPV
jgi:hypothetical protein